MMSMISVVLLCVNVALGNMRAPNIVFILMDDLGWHDVSFNGGQFPTPNIDSLHDEGVSLNRHYIHLMCSPSRTQFLTGRYAMRQGIGKMLPWDYTEIGGIPMGQPTVADWLKTAGYSTYAVGKWHCGYAYQGLLPTSKGFDHFYGFYQGAIHYGTMQYIDIKFGESEHYDFWEDNKEVMVTKPVLENETDEPQINTMYLYRNKILEYLDQEAAKKALSPDSTNPFYMYLPLQTIHGPLDRVHEYEERCDQILGGNVARRSKYCQNMLLTDDVIGAILDKLKTQGLWENTLVVLTTDNGADIANKGCNFPLRGTKGTMFDGNVRGLALISGGVLPDPQKGTTRDALFSSLDWTPTLLHFAHKLNKLEHSDVTWDGMDQHDLIMKGEGHSKENVHRDHIVFNIGLRNLQSASMVFWKNDHLYKYIANDPLIDQWLYKREDGWCVPEPNGDWAMIMDDELSLAANVDNKYLFDLSLDVSERTNLLQLSDQAKDNEEVISYAKGILQSYTEHHLFSEHLPFLWNRLSAGDPALFGEGSFVSPFLSETQYFKHLSTGFGRIEDRFNEAALKAAETNVEFDEVMPFSSKLKGLYFKKWEPPTQVSHTLLSEATNAWYIYAILGLVIVALLVIVIVSVARWRYLRSTNGYLPIPDKEQRKLLIPANKRDPSSDESDSDSDAEPSRDPTTVEYAHINSHGPDADVHTALISVEN